MTQPVQVLLFASLRERARTTSITVELRAGATVKDLVAAIGHQYPDLKTLVSHCRIALDQDFAVSTDLVDTTKEIAAIPPVSGGHDGPGPAQVEPIVLQAEPLELASVVAAVEHPHAGGIATFTGNIRSRSRGEDIAYLEYEAYAPMALKVMRTIATTIERNVEGSRVAIAHRVGRLEIGETAVVIAASAPHRAEAFAACREAIEALKQDVPIWKKEVSTTGDSWIGKGP